MMLLTTTGDAYVCENHACTALGYTEQAGDVWGGHLVERRRQRGGYLGQEEETGGRAAELLPVHPVALFQVGQGCVFRDITYY